MTKLIVKYPDDWDSDQVNELIHGLEEFKIKESAVMIVTDSVEFTWVKDEAILNDPLGEIVVYKVIKK